MPNHVKRLRLMVFMAILLHPGHVFGDEEADAAATRWDLGVIFNADDILLDLESYQGGIGLKLAGYRFAYRALVDFYLTTVSESRATTFGAAVERHYGSGRISPYMGGSFAFSYAGTRQDFAPETWTQTSTLSATLGLLLGVEVFVVPAVSVFAEYGLTGSREVTRTDATDMGVTTRTTTADWTFGVGAGNESKIGIVIYLWHGRELDLGPL